jgi:hypothetical protein
VASEADLIDELSGQQIINDCFNPPRISGHASGLMGYLERSQMRVDTFR